MNTELGEIEQYCIYKINSLEQHGVVQLTLSQQMRDLYVLLLRLTHEIQRKDDATQQNMILLLRKDRNR